MTRILIEPDSRVLLLTGAGASADSGIPTIRDAAGLWESHRVEDVASPEGFARDPQLVWRFYSQRRAGVLRAEPNAGHHAIASLEEKLGDRVLLVTQNVDALHLRAGSERVIEIHGNLMKTRCTECAREPFEDTELYEGTIPFCGECEARGVTAMLRPHIVWFGEMLDPEHLRRIERFAGSAGRRLVFVAIGTSGLVYPAAGLVDVAHRVGGSTWLVNADAAANASSFDHFVEGRSAAVLPGLFEVHE